MMNVGLYNSGVDAKFLTLFQTEIHRYLHHQFIDGTRRLRRQSVKISLRPIENAGLGYLELAEGQLVPISGLEFFWSERRRQTEKPSSRQETLHFHRAQTIADLLQADGVGTGTEASQAQK